MVLSHFILSAPRRGSGTTESRRPTREPLSVARTRTAALPLSIRTPSPIPRQMEGHGAAAKATQNQTMRTGEKIMPTVTGSPLDSQSVSILASLLSISFFTSRESRPNKGAYLLVALLFTPGKRLYVFADLLDAFKDLIRFSAWGLNRNLKWMYRIPTPIQSIKEVRMEQPRHWPGIGMKVSRMQ